MFLSQCLRNRKTGVADAHLQGAAVLLGDMTIYSKLLKEGHKSGASLLLHAEPKGLPRQT